MPPADGLAPADRSYATWPKPVGQPAARERFDSAAAQGLTGVVTPGDPALVATVLDAAERHDRMDEATQRSLGGRHGDGGSPVPWQLHR